jgi:NAD(P)-dependent dehydrogenase (short-subunit alcohol dehydrogenase family)
MVSGKRVLLTGASAGIGLAAAKAFAAHGAQVVRVAQTPEENVPGTRYVRADLSAEGEPARAIAAGWDLLGGLDVLVNNVGVYREPAFTDLTRREFDAVFGLNVWAALACSQEFVRRLVTAGRGGRILFSTSLNATRSEPAHTLYDASKGAVNALVRQLAVELAPHGITTIGIAPGLVETPLTDFGLRSDPAARRTVCDQIPLRRIATVDDLAMWYVFLASDAAAYATGTVVTVDGGLGAQQMSHRPVTRAERSE